MAVVEMARDSGRTGRSPRLDRALAGTLAGVLAGAGLSVVPLSGASAAAGPGMSVAPMPVSAVSLAQAGEVVMWGPGMEHFGDNFGQAAVPASLSGVAVTQIATPESVTLALTAAGRVVSWGADPARLERVPDAVTTTKVAQVTANAANYAGVVTRDGRVLTWGRKTAAASPLNVPAGLSGVKQLALTQQNAVALKTDGSVVAWGDADSALNVPPAGLTATAITTSASAAYALKTDGSVTGWGANLSGELDLPAAVKQPGSVKAIAAFGAGGMALMANDNSVVTWGVPVSIGLQAWLANQHPVAITGTEPMIGTVDGDGAIHQWRTQADQEELLPANLDGRAVATFAVDPETLSTWGGMVVTKMLRGENPAISGKATVGSTLTATPGTFSASPTSVTSQWLANGQPIAGSNGTTLTLTAAQVGKTITYKSTATKSGETTISSTSTAVTVASPPPPAKVGSKTAVTKVKVARKAASVSVTGKVTATKPVTGKATVTIKKGKKTIVAKTVKVSANGAVTLTVKKFGKLAIKKTKSKKKNGYRGSYTVTISYTGNSQVKASKAGKTFKVK